MAFPTTGILDNFNRANEGPPPSASWTNVENGLEVNSNTCKGDANNLGNWSNWNVETFGPDCECYITLTNQSAENLYARLTSVNTWDDGYSVTVFQNEVQIYRLDDGGRTQLGATIAQTSVSGDKLGMEIIGSSVTAYYDDGGAGWGSIGVRSDGAYSNAGYLGVRVFDNDREFDDFGGGTIAAPPAGNRVPIIDHHNRMMAMMGD